MKLRTLLGFKARRTKSVGKRSADDALSVHKYFVVSLHRTGTRSTHELFELLGFNCIHWPHTFREIDLQSRIEGHETDLEFIADTLAPVFDHYDVVSDVPVPVLYRQLAQRYPSAKFVLVNRDPEAWAESVLRHMEERILRPYARAQYWYYVPSRPMAVRELSIEQLKYMHVRHSAEVKEFFAESRRLGEFHLDTPTLSRDIARFAGIDYIVPMPRRGVRKKEASSFSSSLNR
jgi:hypothetical protein